MQRVASIVDLKYAHDRKIYGQGINVCVVDSGIAPHKDLMNNKGRRLIASYDTVNGLSDFYDDSGHGTHVAGIIGAGGTAFRGMAPECGLISVKVLKDDGGGKMADVIRGLEWILQNWKKYNIRIVNISVGAGSEKYDNNSDIVKIVENLWDLGLVVIVAAGNRGPGQSTVSIPGTSRKIITVGASDDDIRVYSHRMSMQHYSGRGPTAECIMKPDIVAPGSGILSLSMTKKMSRYAIKSGTSMATPVVSGAVALLLSKYPELSNRDVKIRLKNTVLDLSLPHEKQGWGLVNVKTLLEGKRGSQTV
ncbi:MAG: S8 family peptidase [Lachnospiraceae bacterium]|nr:S8 family peptidase [Lachnoclostridium sp.]MDY2598633.1 S8 family peptidase [Lachnospiraceae bacterium]